HVIDLRSRTMQRDFDTHARIFERVFQTVAIDLHLPQTHHGLVVEAVVPRLNLAAVLRRLGRRLRLCSGRLKQEDRGAAQNKQDRFHKLLRYLVQLSQTEVKNWGEPAGRLTSKNSEAGEAVSTNLCFVLGTLYLVGVILRNNKEQSTKLQRYEDQHDIFFHC